MQIIRIILFKLFDLMLAILGAFVIVPIALPFGRYENGIDGLPIYRLPRWALWWDNCHDGADGDARLWWHRNCAREAWFGAFKNLKATDFMARWWWLGFRNPVNYWGRMVRGIDASLCELTACRGDKTITDKAGKNGMYIATWRCGKKIYTSMELIIDWCDGTAFYMQIGVKLKPSRDYSKLTDITRFKSTTFEINFAKDVT
jgi:hypothetical protein